MSPRKRGSTSSMLLDVKEPTDWGGFVLTFSFSFAVQAFLVIRMGTRVRARTRTRVKRDRRKDTGWQRCVFAFVFASVCAFLSVRVIGFIPPAVGSTWE